VAVQHRQGGDTDRHTVCCWRRWSVAVF